MITSPLFVLFLDPGSSGLYCIQRLVHLFSLKVILITLVGDLLIHLHQLAVFDSFVVFTHFHYIQNAVVGGTGISSPSPVLDGGFALGVTGLVRVC